MHFKEQELRSVILRIQAEIQGKGFRIRTLNVKSFPLTLRVKWTISSRSCTCQKGGRENKEV